MADLEFRPRMLGIICNWCCYGGADLCGVSRFQYPPFIRLVRVMCSARVDLAHVFRAFAKGLDAVFVGGCHLNDCHYVTNGNYDALGMVELCKRLLHHIGIDPARLRLEWVSAGEGIRFANIMNEYGAQVQKLGPLGSSEGTDPRALRLGLAAATRLVPYIKLVQMERLRVPVRTEAAYHEFFASEEFNRLFERLVLDKLALSRILLLLQEGALPVAEIAARLALPPASVARHVKTSSQQGLVRYDAARRSYSLTGS
jgi:coenzyme F420-reducing hydrogenase delta subunit